MKSQEQRIKDAADVLARFGLGGAPLFADREKIAARILEAADRESPKWPTDESMRLVWGDDASVDDECRSDLRAAFLADPIIRAAIAYRDQTKRAVATDVGRNLIDAVYEAGL